MVDLWTLGGLSWRELLKRTTREAWEDEVYGQAARMAFYHFLALFPALLLAAVLLGRSPGSGAHRLDALASTLNALLPARASTMVADFVSRMQHGAAQHTIWFALFASMWAAFNGTWAVIVGLNAAYEVEERRSWPQILVTTAGLTALLTGIALAGLLVLFYSRSLTNSVIWQIVHWPVLAVVLLAGFALLYRFGPNLADREMRWSTPGAVIAMVLWLGASGLFHAYVSFQASRYDQVYGAAGPVAVLLLWFYFTGVAILIGGEANSEIENAAAQHGHPDASRPGEHRTGGVQRGRA